LKRILKGVFFVLSIILVITFARASMYPAYAQSTVVWVNPASTVGPTSPFSVTVDVDDFTDLYAWEFKLYYNNTILTVTSATAGDLLNNTVGTANTWGLVKSVNDAYNATHGQVWITQTILGHRAGATANPGTGQLATITFTVDGPTGTTPLSLVDTKLVGYNYAAKSIHAIAHTTTDGSVTISAASEFIFGLALEIALLGAVIYVWWNGKHKQKQPSLPSI
jgi:hypothetical protein